MRILCFDIGGTDIKYGVIEDEQILIKDLMPTNHQLGLDSVQNRLLNVARKMIKEYNVEGIGISVAGCVDFDYGIVTVGPDSIPDFNNWNLRKLFEDNVGLKVVVDNDVNCFGVAEGTSGAGAKYHNFLTMAVGTGIGGAIVINGEMWRGLNFKAAEFGRMIIPGGKYESLAATSALVRQARIAGLTCGNGKDVFDLYDQKNKQAIEVVTNFYKNLATGIANLVYIFNPEAIVIGGGISNRKTFATELKRELKKIMNPSFYDTVKIFNAAYANDGGIMGAYYNYLSVYGR